MVAAAILVIVERGIAARRIEADLRLAVARREPGLLDGQRLGRPSGRPVVAVIGDGRDRLARPDLANRLLQPPDEPALRRDRPGIAARPMLVVEHQEEPVGHLGISAQIPVGVADRGRRRDRPAARGEAAVRFPKEAQIVALGGGRELLEIEDDAGAMPGGDHRRHLPEQPRPRRRVAQQGGEAGAVPAALVGILHHRQQSGAPPRAGDDRIEARIGGNAQLVPRPGDEAECRHHPVERVDMGGQRGAAGLVPGDVEAGDELPPAAPAPARPAARPCRSPPPRGGRPRRAGRPARAAAIAPSAPAAARGSARRRWSARARRRPSAREQRQRRQRPPRPPPAAARRIQEDRLGHMRLVPRRARR